MVASLILMDGRQEVADTIARLLAEWSAEAPPPDWENWTIPAFLEAMGGGFTWAAALVRW